MKGNTVANKQVICEVLMENAAQDTSIVVLCSDSRGSASMGAFAEEYPRQFVEVGIAEQNLVSIAAGLASCKKKAFAVSPACFLSTRSLEQARVDVAYSATNVTLVGISGGVSYGTLGMTHHSTQDIATLGSIPGMRVYLPSDRHQTRKLVQALLQDEKPAYVRVGRNAVEDVYTQQNTPFVLDRATMLRDGKDLALIACGEMVAPALAAAALLQKEGIECRVLDMYCVKPIDKQAVLQAAQDTKVIVTVEEHSIIGGMGAMVSQIIAQTGLCPMQNLALPDEAAIAGTSDQVFAHYGLCPKGIADSCRKMLQMVL